MNSYEAKLRRKKQKWALHCNLLRAEENKIIQIVYGKMNFLKSMKSVLEPTNQKTDSQQS